MPVVVFVSGFDLICDQCSSSRERVTYISKQKMNTTTKAILINQTSIYYHYCSTSHLLWFLVCTRPMFMRLSMLVVTHSLVFSEQLKLIQTLNHYSLFRYRDNSVHLHECSPFLGKSLINVKTNENLYLIIHQSAFNAHIQI